MTAPEAIDADDGLVDEWSHESFKPRFSEPMEAKHTTFLPRLQKNGEKQPKDGDHKKDGSDVNGSTQVKLPEIHVMRSNIRHLALHRSITDLLDPEMEILNKVKVMV